MFGLPGKHIFSSNVETTILSNNLIIVESPAKARTMEKYLGPDFEALASYGHVRDLIGSGGRGVVEKVVDGKTIFTPVWELDERGQKQMTAIARAVKSADNVYLATDPDREGEAISWHIQEILREQGVLEAKPVYRVVFYEVTRRAIQEAIDAPRALSLELVEAYLARRILDYLLGFNLSPELWKKIKRGLSAGRVQSPALRLLCDREREIVQFVPREYWTIESDLNAGGADGCFQARLSLLEGNKVEQFSITSTDQAQAIRQRLEQAAGGHLLVRSIEEKPRKRNPAPPFTTSTLQQEASRKLGFGARKTMQVAQQLYEGIDIEGSRVGLITYMRTDSVNVAGEALNELRELITERFGKANLPQTPNRYKSKARNAQEAHEAVRPTSVRRTPESVKQTLTTDQSRLYDLVWKRAVASQMIPATLRLVAVELLVEEDSADVFRATGSTVVDPGYMQVYQEDADDAGDDKGRLLPPLKRGQVVDLETIRAEQHFTEPKPRYTEASLVRELETRGIGRPSTYASILSTLVDREYALLERRRFEPTALGYAVNGFLTTSYEPFVDFEFTARMEEDLDRIASGDTGRDGVIETFWQRLQEHLGTDHPKPVFSLDSDPATGRQVSWRVGPYGAYVQLGDEDDGDEPVRKTLPPGLPLGWHAPAMTRDKALWLLSLPRVLGRANSGEDIVLDTGRYGLYLRCDMQTASIPPGTDPITIDANLAVELLDNAARLPRELGSTADGESVIVTTGRFGPYLKCGSVSASLGKREDPYTIELERALELVAKKRAADAKRTIAVFDGGIKVLRGRWGPFVTDGKARARVAKEQDPQALTLEDCQRLLAETPAQGKKKKAKKKAKKKIIKKTAGKQKTKKKDIPPG